MKKADVKKLTSQFEGFCLEQGLRATEPRKHVLEIVAANKKPATAYDVLELLGKRMPQPKPPTVYRAISFLQEHGFVHRIESLNAYVVCCQGNHPGHHHSGSQFFVCDDCGRVEEVHPVSIPAHITSQAEQSNFKVRQWFAELHGSCAECKS